MLRLQDGRQVLKELSRSSQDVFKVGRRDSAEQLLRALLLQMLYSVRSERLLVEEIDYNILFRWCGAELGRCGVGCHGVHEEP